MVILKRIVANSSEAKATASKRFSGFRPEEENSVKQAEMVPDKTLKQLKEAWGRVQLTDYLFHEPYFNEIYRVANRAIGKLRYTAGDVEKFTLTMLEFQGEEHFSEKAGIFLSALMKRCKDSDFVLHSSHLSEIEYYGYRNEKNIVVEGDVGENVGFKMKGGSITIKGNAGVNAGFEMNDGSITVNGNADSQVGHYMRDGSIIVTGNAGAMVGCRMKGGSIIVYDSGKDVGYFMRGGTIIVKGNAGLSVGNKMSGGSIYLEGNYGGLAAKIFHGKIYHKDVLIVDK